jgi:DNA-binding XRE family transcriptional regulator
MNKPQIIESDGKPAFVVLPFADWQRIAALIEDGEDNAALSAFRANGEETFPIAVADALIAGVNPIRVYRQYRAMTQQELAEKCGVAVPYLSQIETGKRHPSTDVIKKIADALSVSVDDLI